MYVDYAHHPSEITASISAIKPVAKNRLFVIFSRILSAVRQSIFRNSHYRSTPPTKYGSSRHIPRAKRIGRENVFRSVQIRRRKRAPRRIRERFRDGGEKIKETARAGDVIMILGAGDVDIIADLLKE